MHPAFPKCTLLFRNAPDSRENAPRFSGMHPTLRKMHPAFSEMHPEKSKMHPSLFFGAFFYQNMSTKPTERQGYVPTQIIEKREILTVRVSLSHFYPTLIRQLPSHFCFKTLLWVLAQAPPLRYSRTIMRKVDYATRPMAAPHNTPAAFFRIFVFWFCCVFLKYTKFIRKLFLGVDNLLISCIIYLSIGHN